jgi:hypothetical protein
MIERGATHIGVATDHVVEAFRNDLYPGYKTRLMGLADGILWAEKAEDALIEVWSRGRSNQKCGFC